MVGDLQRRHNDDDTVKAINPEKLVEWVARVKVLDRERHSHIEDIQCELEAIRKTEKRKAENEGGGKAKKTNNNNGRSAPPSTDSSSSGAPRNRCPTLTVAERELLNKHKGCTKCRRPYVSHKAATCPNDYPAAANYTALTEAA
ncbi:hypothetical protein B0H12DRAFT_1242453 [Mycena haematopus]|nr:hypothetical protein B0H12DRAFT_1242453 [Mycena haematopus]